MQIQTAVANLVGTCPTCGTELARAKLLEVQRKLREQAESWSKKAAAEAERILAEERRRFSEEQASLEKRNAEQRDALETNRVALDKLKAANAALDKDRKKLIDEAVAKAEQRKEAEMAKRAAAELASVRAASKAEHDKEVLSRKKLIDEAVAKAEQRTQSEMAKKAEANLANARAVLKAEHDKEMLKKMSEVNRDKEAQLKKIKELERKVEAQTANSLGDGAEINIYDELKAAFESKGDKIRRVPKGEPGPDVIQEVLFKGVPCGKIVFDSKNRQGWQNTYTSKLHEDMIEAEADYAILPSLVFPKGRRELCIQDNVMVVSPARVVELVRILRNALIRIHHVGKSNEDRAAKKTRLYDFITSEQFRQRFGDTAKLTDVLVEIDVKEHNAHTKVWDQRNDVIKKMKSALGDIDDEISAIVHTS